MNFPYQDLLDLPHPTSGKHPRMPAEARAAQFAPYAALTGYGATIVETARITDSQIELDESENAVINDTLLQLQEQSEQKPSIRITHFVPDERKSGGQYVTTTSTMRKIDDYERLVLLSDGASISFDYISRIETDIVNEDAD